ncbi:MAG: NAD(P)H-dependent oxidoreductase subunit E [Spirochaetia bacterium]
MAVIEDKTEITSEILDFARKWKNKPGNLIMVLHKVQSVYGYIPRNVAIELSKELDIPLAKIYGVVTFYHFFKLNKPGRNRIAVCMGTACYLKGGEDIIQELENLLGIGVNSVTEDGEFSVEAVRCIGCCGLAPVMSINDEVYGKVTKAELPEILAKHREA